MGNGCLALPSLINSIPHNRGQGGKKLSFVNWLHHLEGIISPPKQINYQLRNHFPMKTRSLNAQSLVELIVALILILSAGKSHALVAHGTLATNTHWTIEDSPVTLVGDLTISNGATLTIDPGVLISGEFRIDVVGGIHSNGTSEDQIRFAGCQLVFNFFSGASLDDSELSYTKFSNGEFGYESGFILPGVIEISDCIFENTVVDMYNMVETDIPHTYFYRCLFSGKSMGMGDCIVSESTFQDLSLYPGYGDLMLEMSSLISVQIYAESNLLTLTGCTGVDVYSKRKTPQSTPNKYGTLHLFNSKFTESSLGDENVLRIENCVFDGAKDSIVLVCKEPMISNSTFITGGNKIAIRIIETKNTPKTTNYIENCTFIGEAAPINIYDNDLRINGNNFDEVVSYTLLSQTIYDIDATGNYWGTTDEQLLSERIYDKDDIFTFGEVDFQGYLDQYSDDAPIVAPEHVFKVSSDADVRVFWEPLLVSDIAGYLVFVGDTFFTTTDTSLLVSGYSYSDEFSVSSIDNQADGDEDICQGHQSYQKTTARSFMDLAIESSLVCSGNDIEVNFSVDEYLPSETTVIAQLTPDSVNSPNLLFSDTLTIAQVASGYNKTVPDSIANGWTWLSFELPQFDLSYRFDSVYLQLTPNIEMGISDTDPCVGDTVALTVSNKYEQTVEYIWNTDGAIMVSDDVVDSVQVKWMSQQSYSPTVQATINSCSSNIAELTFETYDPSVSVFESGLHLCEGAVGELKINGSFSEEATVTWNINDLPIVDTLGNNWFQYEWEAGEFPFEIEADDHGCAVIYTDTVSMYENPSSSFTLASNIGCSGDTALFKYTGLIEENMEFDWSTEWGAANTIYDGDSLVVIWDDFSTTYIGLTVNQNGCESSTSEQINVYAPSGYFESTEHFCYQSSHDISFYGVYSNQAVLTWEFGQAQVADSLNKFSYRLNWVDFDSTIVAMSVDDHGCIYEEQTTIYFHDSIPMSITSPSSVCSEEFINLIYDSTIIEGGSVQWKYGGQTKTGKEVSFLAADVFGYAQINCTVFTEHCTSTENFDIIVSGEIQPYSICMVNTDSSNQNVIHWDWDFTGRCDSVIVYKEGVASGNYEEIGVVSSQSEPRFVDIQSIAQQNSSKYKIAALDSCGRLGEMSDYHKTLHLTVNEGINGSYNLIWDSYEGFDYSTFYIYRGNTDSTLLKIGEIAGGNFTYSDLNPNVGTNYYQIAIDAPIGCGEQVFKTGNDGLVFSNMVLTTELSASGQLAQDFSMVLVNQNLMLSSESRVQGALSVFNAVGQEVLYANIDSDQKQVFIGHLPVGVYTCLISDGGQMRRFKFVLQGER